jgi:hypothetical protein
MTAHTTHEPQSKAVYLSPAQEAATLAYGAALQEWAEARRWLDKANRDSSTPRVMLEALRRADTSATVEVNSAHIKLKALLLAGDT